MNPAAFAEAGFAVTRGAFDAAAVDRLRAEAVAICRGDRGRFDGIQEIPAEVADLDVLARYLCVHFPHKMSPTIRRALSAPEVVEPLVGVLGPNVKCMQSMFFVKAPGKPGQAWHQDEMHIPTRDRSLTAAWIALDDATEENGCLWVLPGSHRAGILWPTRPCADDRFDGTPEAFGFSQRDEEAIPLELATGDVAFFHGYLLHRSFANRSGRFRRALVNHYMRAESLLPWFPDGRPIDHAATADYRDIVLVAGVDPYAARGIEDGSRPYARPTRR